MELFWKNEFLYISIDVIRAKGSQKYKATLRKQVFGLFPLTQSDQMSAEILGYFPETSFSLVSADVFRYSEGTEKH